MKKSLFIAAFLAAAATMSCTKDPAAQSNNDKAYMSVAINLPSPVTTRGLAENPGTNPGTAEEQAVNSVYVVGLNGDAVKGVYTLSSAEQGTVGVGGTAAVAGEPFLVSPDIDGIFVLINPSEAVLASTKSASTYHALNSAITELVSRSKAGGFMMTSAGQVPGDKGIVAVTPKVAASQSTADIEAAKAEAKADPKSVSVNRTMAKVQLAATSTAQGTLSVENNASATIDGWKLNTTNTRFYPYAELVSYTLPEGKGTPATYREDPNFSKLTMTIGADHSVSGEAASQFIWLDNKDNIASSQNPIAWNLAGESAEYCHENTMEVSAQDYNNTTKMIVKATYAPAGVTLGDSWFRVRGIVMSFDDMVADFNAHTEGSDVRKGYEAFAQAMGAQNFASLNFNICEAVENAGYKAACASTYTVEYFQKGVCYYDVNIKHDNRQQEFGLARWGVVRNNWYTLSVSKITKPGKPYIPDPTDPDITDPENPDPEDPTPDDEHSAYISVEVTINPWTTWTQEVTL